MLERTKFKYSEAQYFLSRMEECRNRRDEFRFNLSAFVTASESFLEFLLLETNAINSSLNKWRKERVDNIRKDRLGIIISNSRKQTVHRKPLEPKTEEKEIPKLLPEPIDMEFTPVFVNADGSISYGVVPKGNVIPIYTYEKESQHYFKGSESDVITICREHLKNLNELLLSCETKYTGKQSDGY